MRHPWKSLLSGPSIASAVLAAALMSGPVSGADESATATNAAAAKSAALPATTQSQREAAAILDGMAKYLAGLQSFTCTLVAGYDVLQATGQKIEFGERRHVAMDRPNRLRVEEVSSDGFRDLALFDGKTMTAMNADAGVFAQAPQPGPVDDALVYFVRDLQMRMPLALLLTTRLPAELPNRVKTVDYVESVELSGVPAHHIAGRTDSVDFQFWITQGEHPLPIRVVITYAKAEGMPQYWANFTEWNASPKFSPTEFQFAPPKDARQISFAVQLRKPAAAAGEIQP
jgi:hypothetical protein